jgi:MFS family permease
LNGAAGKASGAAWRLAVLLFVANTLSFVDRQILTLLVKPIRADLHITDTQIALLQGLAFASFYALLGLPLGRWADRGDRPRLIAAGIALWSVMTAASGLARDFGHLFLARMGVAVGEAALAPAAVSLLSDRFPRERVGGAIGLFQSGIFVGSALALLAGGALLAALGATAHVPVLGELPSWRVVFLAVGAPGLLVAVIMLMVQEPRRAASSSRATTPLPLAEALRWLWQRRALYGPHIAAFTAITILAYGALSWAPTVLVRVHGLTPAQAGLRLGAMMLVMGPLGVIGSGVLIDRLLRRGIGDGPVRVALIGVGLFTVSVPAFALAPDLASATIAALFLSFAQSFPYGIATAALALVTPPHMRGQVTALYLLVSNLVGLTLGPLLVALGTDYLFGSDQAVGRSLALLPVLTMPVALAALLALRAPYARAVREGGA